MHASSCFSSLLDPYKRQIEQKLQHSIPHLFPDHPLRNACEYALLNGGKRFRPALVLMIAEALGYGQDVNEAALGIEFFHTASLIADDLPCMDNDQERRNRPTLHCVYGESIALLTTYALISAGYACLAKNTCVLSPFLPQREELCRLAVENVSYNTGARGATGGQLLDLAPPPLSLSVLKDIIHKKTGTLFEISFVFGWIFGGGDLKQLDLIKKSAAHFGLAFQIADDLGDQEQDAARSSLNFANYCGKEKAREIFHAEMQDFNRSLGELKLKRGCLDVLSALLVSQVEGS